MYESEAIQLINDRATAGCRLPVHDGGPEPRGVPPPGRDAETDCIIPHERNSNPKKRCELYEYETMIDVPTPESRIIMQVYVRTKSVYESEAIQLINDRETAGCRLPLHDGGPEPREHNQA